MSDNPMTHKFPSMEEIHASCFPVSECMFCEDDKLEGRKYCQRHQSLMDNVSLESKLRYHAAAMIIKTVVTAGR